MEVVSKDSKLWNYLPEEIQGLVADGERILTVCAAEGVSDYSYLVFPFAKAYEGFLKKLFLDLKMIRDEDFYGEKIRIGRILNPIFIKKRYSVYRKLNKREKGSGEITGRLWRIWKRGRNKVFHYFPHNFRRLSKKESLEIINEIVGAMSVAMSLLD